MTGTCSFEEASQHARATARPSPGKRTLVEHAYRDGWNAPPSHQGAGPPVAREQSADSALSTIQALSGGARAAIGQPGGGGGNQDEAAIHASAQRAIATPASRLPHHDVIQRAFGRHDISSIQAHVGPDAAASAREMGAEAYTMGTHVVVGANPDLFTMAHEAAHVVQQRGGVKLVGGVGRAGDPYERHADAVADLVVRGVSAEALLDERAGAGAGATSSGAVSAIQRKVGFEFETGITVSRDDIPLTKKTQIGTPKPTPAGRSRPTMTGAWCSSWIPRSISKDLPAKLATIFDAIEHYCASLEHATSEHRTLVVEEEIVQEADPFIEDSGFAAPNMDDSPRSWSGSTPRGGAWRCCVARSGGRTSPRLRIIY